MDRLKNQKRGLCFSTGQGTLPNYITILPCRKGRYKLVGNTDYNSPVEKFELYDIDNDPYENKNIVKVLPEIASDLKTELDKIAMDLLSSENWINDHILKPERVLKIRLFSTGTMLMVSGACGNRKKHTVPGGFILLKESITLSSGS